MNDVRLLIVGNPGTSHVGAHLRAAAEEMSIAVELCDTRAAFDAAWLERQWHWRVRGHNPPRLRAFQTSVLERCEGNRSEAAQLLGIGRNTLTRKLKTYGL